MRLLNVHSFQLEEYSGDQIPKYAILSHTWGSDEVIFEELNSPKSRLKDGWKKIDYICREAKKRGLNYVWVDTCNIAKSSSAELSEAINSMFMWYQNSEICCAYLADVQTTGFDVDIAASRWFTRGWTLQELLAPKKVEFFDRQWISLGSRNQLAKTISVATGIDVEVLEDDGLQLSKKSVACRMSWASTRKTTRVEDRAYSLLGIFSVNMPLLYGEGPRAFMRLQEEILKVSNDHSLFAWDLQTTIKVDVHDIHQYSTVRDSHVGCLAADLEAFKNSGKVSPIPTKPSSHVMTSLGLQIKLPVLSTSFHRHFALLRCQLEGQEQHCIGIQLSEVYSYQSGVYDRVKEGGRWSATLIPIEDAIRANLQTIFIVRADGIPEGLSRYTTTMDLIEHPYMIVTSNDNAKVYLKEPVLVLPTNMEWDSRRRGVHLLPRGQDFWVILLYCPAHLRSLRVSKQSVLSVFAWFREQNRGFPIGGLREWPLSPRLPIPSSKDEWRQWAETERVSDLSKYQEYIASLTLRGKPELRITLQISGVTLHNHHLYELKLNVDDLAKS